MACETITASTAPASIPSQGVSAASLTSKVEV